MDGIYKAAKPEVATAKQRQLVDNKELALGVTKDGVARARQVIGTFGAVLPLVVARLEDGETFKILNGQSVAKAARSMGVQDVPIVIAGVRGEKQFKLLALQLTAQSSEPVAILQGVLIESLVKEHGVAPGALSRLLQVSKSWLSKRQSLARSLSDNVKTLVSGGVLAPRSAEEVAKLPEEAQLAFADNIVKGRMPKDAVAKLVAMHNDPGTPLEVRELILSEPWGVDMAKPRKLRRVRRPCDDLEKVGSLLRCAVKACHSARAKLDELYFGSESGRLPEPRQIKEVFDSSRKLAELAQNILSAIARDEAGRAPAETFPRGKTGCGA